MYYMYIFKYMIYDLLIFFLLSPSHFFNKEINFLDTVVYKAHSCQLESKLYRKASNQQGHLYRKSIHHESLK